MGLPADMGPSARACLRISASLVAIISFSVSGCSGGNVAGTVAGTSSQQSSSAGGSGGSPGTPEITSQQVYSQEVAALNEQLNVSEPSYALSAEDVALLEEQKLVDPQTKAKLEPLVKR